VHFRPEDILVANHSAGVDHPDRWPTIQFPLLRNRSVFSSVPKRAPGDLLLDKHALELFAVRIAVDAGESERLTFQTLDERPLVRVQGPARASPIAPEVEDHHLSPVVRELEPLAIDVLAVDLQGGLADLGAGSAGVGRHGWRGQSRSSVI